MSLKFSMLLQAVDRVTAPAKRIQQSMRGIGQSAKTLAADLKHPDRAYQRGYALGQRLRGGLDRVALGFRKAGGAAKWAAGKAGIASWNDAAKKAGSGAVELGKKLGGVAMGAARWAGAATVGAAGFGLFDLFKTAGKFEQYRIMLNNSMGGEAQGKQALGWISTFAAETPYELDQVIEAFQNLKNVAGVDPTDGSLRIVGDTAAGLSKDIMQVSEAYSDAVNMQFERLLDLGLRATQQGNKVTFQWRQNGKAMTKTVKKEGLEIKRALDEIWGGQFGGNMVAQSKSLFGIISNLKDKWSQFLVLVAEAGIFEKVKNSLQGWLDRINQMAADGSLKIWAQEISDRLGKVWDKFGEFVDGGGLVRAGEDLKRIAEAAVILADAIIKIGNAGPRFQSALNIASGPAGWWKEFSAQSDNFSGSRATSSAAPRPAGPPTAQQKRDFAPGARVSPFLAKPSGKKTAVSDVRVGGAAQVSIALSPGLTAKLNNLKSSGDVPFSLSLGKTMGGMA